MSEQDLNAGLCGIWQAGVLGAEINGPKLIQDLDDLIVRNYQRLEEIGCAKSSTQNWRWFANPVYDPQNTSLETIVEREVIRLTHALGTWANQVPTNSGICEGNNKAGHIDLAHRTTEQSFELIELKIESNDPYEAALQITRYGLAYRLFRRFSRLLRASGPTTKKLFDASRIHLRVLAPARYYKGINTEIVERALCEGFDHVLERENWKMDFAFLQFPDWFWPNPAELRHTLEPALVGRAPLHGGSATSA